jgi:hypothetical protein
MMKAEVAAAAEQWVVVEAVVGLIPYEHDVTVTTGTQIIGQ